MNVIANTENGELFHHVPLPCPICKKVAQHKALSPDQYKERDREIDFRPRSFTWQHQTSGSCHPPLFYMWSCDSCHFTAAAEHFAEPSQAHGIPTSVFRIGIETGRLRPNYQALQTLLSQSRSQSEDQTVASALAQHLWAIYLLEGISEITERETLVLARYYTRSAWLLRDARETFRESLPEIDSLLRETRKIWPQVPADEKQFLEAAERLMEIGLEKSSVPNNPRDEIELILLTARICMKIGDLIKAKSLGNFCREQLMRYETILENDTCELEGRKEHEKLFLKGIQSDVLSLIAEAQNQ